MKPVDRMMTNICSDRLEESKVFYTKLFDFKVDFESDWFIHLISEHKHFELGIIQKTNEIVPEEAQVNPAGFYITFVVDQVDDLYELAQKEEMEVITPPKNTFYGQRRIVLKDPDGVFVDISSPIPDFKF
ncbi:MAG: VOC family protein [Bacteroidota bacterium]